MNKAELLTQIANRYRSASRNFVTDAEMLLELNRVIDRLNAKVDLETTILQFVVPFTGSGFYAFMPPPPPILPPGPPLFRDIKKPISLWDGVNQLLYKRVTKSFLDQDAPNNNNEYAIVNTGLWISSISSAVPLTFTWYSKLDCFDALGNLKKGLSADDDTPALQDQYHDYLVEETAAVLFRKERKWDDYKIAKEEAAAIYQDIIDENPTRMEKVVELFGGYPQQYN